MEITIFSSGTQPSVKRGVFLLAALLALNIIVCLILLTLGRAYPLLLGLTALAWGLGLRHAMDADHVAAIDNVTRRLLYRGKPSVGIGFFFSLGHSTVVLLLTVLILFAASFTASMVDLLRGIGAEVGGSISAVFLIGIGAANLFVLHSLFRARRNIINGKENTYHGHLHLGGPIEKLFRPLVALVDKSHKMYGIGLLFGLGFDTATEVGLLALSALALSAAPPYALLLLPIAFAAGMMLLDTLNSLLMLGIYSWGGFDELDRLTYNISVTALSSFSALVVGSVIGLRLFASHFDIHRGIFALAENAPIGYFGYALALLFILLWVSALMRFLKKQKAR